MKAKQFSLIVLSVLACLQTGQGQNWTLTAAPVKNWSAVASSADGGKLIAAINNGGIYISTNSGATWYLSGAPTRSWYSIASSSNSSNLVASATGATSPGIYTSTNIGATWTYQTNLFYVRTVATSTNGMNLLAGNWGPGNIYTSTNYGATWQKTTAPQGYWTASACSADGSKLFVGQGGSAYGSTNAGFTWNKINTNDLDSSGSVGMGCSADGNVLMLVAAGGSFGGGIYVSTNGGSTWKTNIVANGFLASVAVSADGRRGVAPDVGLNYFSADAGQTWLSSGGAGFIKFVASSFDGTRLVAAVQNGGIYVSQPPSLTATLVSNTMTVSWPSTAAGWNLWVNTNCSNSNWNPAAEIVQDNGFNKYIVVNATNDNRFYRLSNP